MKSSYKKLLCLTLAFSLITVFFVSCGKNGDNTGTSSAAVSNSSSNSASITSSIIVSPSRSESADTTSHESLSESELEYLKKLFSCMLTANFSSKYSLNDQICMQFIENIINYQDTTGDKFFLNITPNSAGDYTLDKATAESICNDLFNYTLLHDSDYLTGDSYYFPAAGGVVPVIEITKTNVIGVMFQIYYTTTVGDSEPVNHIASILRNDDDVTPFRFQSLTINS